MIKLVYPETLFYIFFTIAESLLSHLALDVRSVQLIVYLSVGGCYLLWWLFLWKKVVLFF